MNVSRPGTPPPSPSGTFFSGTLPAGTLPAGTSASGRLRRFVTAGTPEPNSTDTGPIRNVPTGDIPIPKGGASMPGAVEYGPADARAVPPSPPLLYIGESGVKPYLRRTGSGLAPRGPGGGEEAIAGIPRASPGAMQYRPAQIAPRGAGLAETLVKFVPGFVAVAILGVPIPGSANWTRQEEDRARLFFGVAWLTVCLIGAIFYEEWQDRRA